MVYCFLLCQLYDNYVTSAFWSLHTYINEKETESSETVERHRQTFIRVPFSIIDIQFLVISLYFIL